MRREATIYAGRPISAPAVAKPQHDGSWRAPTNAPACRSDSYHMRRRGAKSFVDDLVLSRGVVLSRADLFCDLLRLSPMTRRFVRFRRTYLLWITTVDQASCGGDARHRRMPFFFISKRCRTALGLAQTYFVSDGQKCSCTSHIYGRRRVPYSSHIWKITLYGPCRTATRNKRG